MLSRHPSRTGDCVKVSKQLSDTNLNKWKLEMVSSFFSALCFVIYFLNSLFYLLKQEMKSIFCASS